MILDGSWRKMGRRRGSDFNRNSVNRGIQLFELSKRLKWN